METLRQVHKFIFELYGIVIAIESKSLFAYVTGKFEMDLLWHD